MDMCRPIMEIKQSILVGRSYDLDKAAFIDHFKFVS